MPPARSSAANFATPHQRACPRRASQRWDQDGKCYFKLNSVSVLQTWYGHTVCVTDRKPPSAFSYSFVNIFGVFDFLVEVGVKPIVEIGFMPELLAATRARLSSITKVARHPQLQRLARPSRHYGGIAGATALQKCAAGSSRCGTSQTAAFMMRGCCGEACGNQSAYLDMYVNTWQALKKQDPQLSVGGLNGTIELA